MIAQHTKIKAIPETVDVAIPDRRDRTHPDRPTLTRSAITPTTNPNALTIRAVSADDPTRTLVAASGCRMKVNVTDAMTATTKLQAAVAADPTTQLATRLEGATTNKVAKNVAAKPPKNALRNASCRAISIR